MKNRRLWLSALVLVSGSSWAQGPAFKCDKVEAESVEALICQDAELAAEHTGGNAPASEGEVVDAVMAASAKAGPVAAENEDGGPDAES